MGDTVSPFALCQCGCGEPAPIARQTDTAKGYVKGQPTRFILGHHRTAQFHAATRTHGRSRTSEHNSYVGARARCTNPDDEAYLEYGGRGIEFRFASFEEFHAELGDKPEPKRSYSVDRIDNDGHYEPGNVRWATRQQQANNRRPRRWRRKPNVVDL